MDTYTVSFFGHRDFEDYFRCVKDLEDILSELIRTKEYVEFLVGSNGEFDRFVSSVIRTVKRLYGAYNSAHVLVLPDVTREYRYNQKGLEEFYDEIEICEQAQDAHYKAKIQTRNRKMVDRSHLVICYIKHASGGAYQTIRYAKKQGKPILNLAEQKNYF